MDPVSCTVGSVIDVKRCQLWRTPDFLYFQGSFGTFWHHPWRIHDMTSASLFFAVMGYLSKSIEFSHKTVTELLRIFFQSTFGEEVSYANALDQFGRWILFSRMWYCTVSWYNNTVPYMIYHTSKKYLKTPNLPLCGVVLFGLHHLRSLRWWVVLLF
jgi:hypothetical protein